VTGRQLDLFPARSPIGLAAEAAGLASLGRGMAPWVRLGTSSWSFPGWTGLVWDRPATPGQLSRYGLAAYARHPLLRTVGLDRTYYAPLDAAGFATLAEQTPADFRFLVKAPEDCTAPHFSNLERHGSRRGQRNARFLDAAWTTDVVVGPMRAGLAEQAGPLVFQFSPMPAAAVGGPERFAGRLHRFLGALPRGPVYAVEVRTPALLTRAYAAALADAGACHCLTAHPSMPDVETQAAAVALDAAPAVVVRWMLGRGLSYEAGVTRYRPFDRLVDPDPSTREAVARLCIVAASARRPAFVVVNNKAEGSAPCSVVRLAERVAALARGAA